MTWEEAYLKEIREKWQGRRCWWIPCDLYQVEVPDTLDIWECCPKCGHHRKIRDGVEWEIMHLKAIVEGWTGQGLWWPRNKAVQQMAKQIGMKQIKITDKGNKAAYKWWKTQREPNAAALDEANAIAAGWNPNQ